MWTRAGDGVKFSLKTGTVDTNSHLSQTFRKRNVWLNDFNTTYGKLYGKKSASEFTTSL